MITKHYYNTFDEESLIVRYASLLQYLPIVIVAAIASVAIQIYVFGEQGPLIWAVLLPLTAAAISLGGLVSWWSYRHEKASIAAIRHRLYVCSMLLMLAGLATIACDIQLLVVSDTHHQYFLMIKLAFFGMFFPFMLANLGRPAYVYNICVILATLFFPLILHVAHAQPLVCMILIFEAGMLMAMRSRNNIFDALVVSSVKSKQLASDNEMLANLDPLTGLPNRRHFFTDLKTQQTHKRRQPHTEFAVGIIDIDRFKVINDSFGHRIGDLVLIEIGKRLQPVHRHLGTAQMYRIGGDVFAFIQQFNHTEAAVIHGKTIIDTIERTIMIDCIPFNLSASIGIAFLSAFENTPELIYEYAGHALTHAKHAGRGQVACFSNAHFEQLLRRKNIEKELRIAIEQDQLYPVFQPIQHLPTGKPLAFECLARWHHPHLGTVDPDVFIGIAENIGLISNVTVALFSKALVEVQRWPDSIDLSFNLSANDIMNEALIATITKMILRSHIGAERFTFEITETGLLKNFQTTKRNVERLKSFGCNIALDDFGTGYSSLSHVQELPLHKIKIDKRFVRDIETNAKNRMIVSSIFGLSQGIQIECVIEGAETASQIAILKDLGCTQVQGYYYSMPLSAKEVSGYLEAHL